MRAGTQLCALVEPVHSQKRLPAPGARDLGMDQRMRCCVLCAASSRGCIPALEVQCLCAYRSVPCGMRLGAKLCSNASAASIPSANMGDVWGACRPQRYLRQRLYKAPPDFA